MNHFFKISALAVATLMSMTAAQAVVITFTEPIATTFAPAAPLLGHNDNFFQEGIRFIPFSNTAGAVNGDLVGAIIDSADQAGICGVLLCPSNPTGTFYAGLDDGYLQIGTSAAVQGFTMNLASLSASFIGAQGETIPATAAILRISGHNAAGTQLTGATQDFFLAGPTAGVLSFANFTANAALQAGGFSFLRIRAAVCDAAGSCLFTGTNRSQYALDNLNITAVPEPSQWALLGLGIVGIAAIVRRRRSA